MPLEFLLRQKGDTQNPQLASLTGKGSTRGMPCYRKIFSGAGATATWAYLSLIMNGGRWGCDGVDRVYCNGGLIPEVVSGQLRWKFHPGTASLGWGDSLQGRPHFFPELDDTFSGISYIEGLMTPGVDDPSRMEFFVRGLKVMDYEYQGGMLHELGPAFKSDNNALAGIYVLTEMGRLPLTQINRHAASWIAFKETCDELLPWLKTVADPDAEPPIEEEIINVPRYNSHVPFSTSMDTTTAYESIMLRAPGASWQWVSGGVQMLPSPNRAASMQLQYDPTQVAQLSNIVKGSFSGSPAKRDLLPNFFHYQYHDIEDEAYELKDIFVDRAELRDAMGGTPVVVGPLNLGLMYESLVQRIAKMQVRLLVDLPYTAGYNVSGRFDSYKIAKADNVELVHKLLGRTLDNPVLARIVYETFSETKGERKFKARLTTMDYYRDSDHGPKEGGSIGTGGGV
jgi:hypothetical protein